MKSLVFAFSALTLLVGRQEGHPACKKTEWWGVGVVICLDRGADVHIAQRMPLSLIVSCFSKIQIGFSLLAPAHLGSPRQRAVKRVCVCVCACVKSLVWWSARVVYLFVCRVGQAVAVAAVAGHYSSRTVLTLITRRCFLQAATTSSRNIPATLIRSHSCSLSTLIHSHLRSHILLSPACHSPGFLQTPAQLNVSLFCDS